MADLCAYCGREKPLTREHIVPQWLYEETRNHDLQFLRRPRRFVNTEVKIKDVCADCNNGALSDLDGYAKSWYRQYCQSFVQRGDKVVLDYQFDPLVRWLLKISYNSARMYKEESSHAAILQKTAPYIIGQAPRPSKLRVFVQLIVPYQVKANELHLVRPGVTELPPMDIRVARAFASANGDQVIVRLIGLKSYYFYLIIPRDETTPRDISRTVARRLQEKLDHVHQLRPDKTRVVMAASATDALQAVEFNVSYYWKEHMEYFGKGDA